MQEKEEVTCIPSFQNVRKQSSGVKASGHLVAVLMLLLLLLLEKTIENSIFER